MSDSLRCTGRTTKQMLDAPVDAVFISCHEGALTHDRHLAAKHGRPDLKIAGQSWLTNQGWRGLGLSGIVVDHAASLTVAEKHALREALSRVRRVT